MRLYDDLTRSHLNVWRDQISGDPTADFLEEFLTKIDECDDFLILDSKNYRTKSNWCLTEIERCFHNRTRRNGPRVIVCLLDQDGDWRYTFRNVKQKELFTKVNMFKYHTLFYDGTYDNDDIYQKSIVSICNLFDERYIPWNCMPPNRDILEELSASKAQVSDSDRTIILHGYEYIANFIDKNRDVNDHFRLWISDCEYLNLSLFFPRWTYCVWLGHNMHHGKYDIRCFEEFRKLAEDFPHDPRAFRGVGCIAAKLGENAVSIAAFEQALDLMKFEDNQWHKKNSELEVLTNLGQVYINTEQPEKAIDFFSKALSIMESEDIFELQPILNLVYCMEATGKYSACKTLLKRLLDTHRLEAELYSELGTIYTLEDNNGEAITCFEQAYILTPSVKNAFFLLCRKSVIHDVSVEAFDVLNRDVYQIDEYYWKGAISYYILNDFQKAKLYYEKSGGLYDWYQ